MEEAMLPLELNPPLCCGFPKERSGDTGEYGTKELSIGSRVRGGGDNGASFRELDSSLLLVVLSGFSNPRTVCRKLWGREGMDGRLTIGSPSSSSSCTPRALPGLFLVLMELIPGSLFLSFSHTHTHTSVTTKARPG